MQQRRSSRSQYLIKINREVAKKLRNFASFAVAAKFEKAIFDKNKQRSCEKNRAAAKEMCNPAPYHRGAGLYKCFAAARGISQLRNFHLLVLSYNQLAKFRNIFATSRFFVSQYFLKINFANFAAAAKPAKFRSFFATSRFCVSQYFLKPTSQTLLLL